MRRFVKLSSPSTKDQQRRSLFTPEVGDNLIRLVSDEAVTVPVHWAPDQQKYIECNGKECPFCKDKHKPQYKTYLTIICRKNNMKMLWGIGTRLWNQLRAVINDAKTEGIDITTRDLKVHRTGEGLETEYAVRLAMKPATPAEEEEIKRAMTDELISLDTLLQPKPPVEQKKE